MIEGVLVSGVRVGKTWGRVPESRCLWQCVLRWSVLMCVPVIERVLVSGENLGEVY